MPTLKKSRPKAPAAPKSPHRPKYKAVLETLLEMREDADLLQSKLSKKLGRSHSYVSIATREAIVCPPCNFPTGTRHTAPRSLRMSTDLIGV